MGMIKGIPREDIDWTSDERGTADRHEIYTHFSHGQHRTQGGFTASDTVGLVVEYAPATGETRDSRTV